MTDYSKMSDFEINKAVAIKLGLKPYYDDGKYSHDGEFVVTRGPKCLGRWEPCKEPHQAWSIIVENKISLNAHGLHAWMAWKNTGSTLEEISSNRHQHSAIWDNPLRAAMIVFLMIKEPENDS
ncbi:putative NinX protein [Erwinia phage vB_EhrS_49]|uniref:Putative NinX protein n=1 Tax=Erwinia phage vB_EhrS_49 TaxID=2283026 RepID=A0A4Y1NR98_9CAUD|nr:putative NinX protein [Erwinia phage vB_EhrS_49]AXH43508.1 putative NinX protein [Erwinia phage vB_EhrS_49]